jgi:hypothetical protein
MAEWPTGSSVTAVLFKSARPLAIAPLAAGWFGFAIAELGSLCILARNRA